MLLFISAPTYTSPSAPQVPSLPIANTPVISIILTLVQYVYATTTRLESEEEPLRNLISTFIALNYDHIQDKGGEVSRFMEQGGDF